MGINAALADEFQVRKAFQKVCANRCAFAKQHQRFGVLKACRKAFGVRFVIRPYGDVMAVQLFETRQSAQGIARIV